MHEYQEIQTARHSLGTNGLVVVPPVIEPSALALPDRVALFYRGWGWYPESTRKKILPAAAGEDYPGDRLALSLRFAASCTDPN